MLFVLILDQTIKIWVKTHMMPGQEYTVIGSWFRIHFIENNGMAFGIEFGGEPGKIFLGLLRIAVVIGIGWYLNSLIRQEASKGLVFCVALILAGAIGNILDSAFYGLIFSDSHGHLASFMPAQDGYSTFLQGKVVDMLFFPLIHSEYPEWIPFVGGKDFLFFRDIFNISDASIFLGVVSILLFRKRFFRK